MLHGSKVHGPCERADLTYDEVSNVGINDVASCITIVETRSILLIVTVMDCDGLSCVKTLCVTMP